MAPDTAALATVLDLYEQGHLTAEQAMTVLLIDTGRRQRSAQSKLVGNAVEAFTAGEIDVNALQALIGALPDAPERTDAHG